MNIVEELRAPATIDGLYDVLVVTEEHTLLETILKSDTVRLLRYYHEQFLKLSPNGTTYFYHPWFAVDDKSDPRRWIAYERSALPIWECIATRINVSLETEGRKDRIISLPASAALAFLIDEVTRDSPVPAISRGSIGDTMNRFFSDDVHLQPLGMYYLSLVTYGSIYGRTTRGAWHPPEIADDEAASLQQLADRFVAGYYAEYQPLSLEACRARLLSDEGLAPMWSYIRDAYWRKDIGSLRGYARYFQRLSSSRRVFGAEGQENPFFFDPASDTSYWHRADR